MEILYENLLLLDWRQVAMWVIGGVLIFLAIKKNMEPSLLLPIGFGAILVNLPLSGAVDQVYDGVTEPGIIDVLFNAGIANELFPLILFVGIGAMIDFTPLLSNPKLMIFGAAAQFGIFFTLCMATLLGFELPDAASIAIIGAADGPTSIFVANYFNTQFIGAVVVVAYSYMALVPIVQPPVIRLITSRKERRIRMEYASKPVSKTTKILFPIIITIIAGLVSPRSVSLIGFLMFGNLIRECGVLDSLSETAQKVLANLVTLFLGITVATKMQYDAFLTVETPHDPVPGPGGLCVRYRGRRAHCQALQPVPEEEDQPHDRCFGHFRLPHVGPGGQQNGPEGRQPELPAHARRGRECVGPDRFGHRRRPDFEPVWLKERSLSACF